MSLVLGPHEPVHPDPGCPTVKEVRAYVIAGDKSVEQKGCRSTHLKILPGVKSSLRRKPIQQDFTQERELFSKILWYLSVSTCERAKDGKFEVGGAGGAV